MAKKSREASAHTATLQPTRALGPTLGEIRNGQSSLKIGHRGEAVAYVQDLLGITCGNIYLGALIEAVKVFQSKQGLTAHGHVDQVTLRRLEEVGPLTPEGQARSTSSSSGGKGRGGSSSSFKGKVTIEFLNRKDPKDTSDATSVKAATQFVNLTQDKKWMDTIGSNGAKLIPSLDRLGQHIGVVVRFSTPGVYEFKLKLVPFRKNVDYNTEAPETEGDSEVARNANFSHDHGPRPYKTNPQGVCVIENDFRISAAGANEYKFVAISLDEKKEFATSEWLKTSRILYYTVLNMQGISRGCDFTDVTTTFKEQGITLVAVKPGTEQIPHRRFLKSGLREDPSHRPFLEEVNRACQEQLRTRRPLALAIVFIDCCARSAEYTLEKQVSGGKMSVKVKVETRGKQQRFLWHDIIPGESWYVSASYTIKGAANGVAVPMERISLVRTDGSGPVPLYGEVEVDLSTIPNPSGAEGTLQLKVRCIESMPSGVAGLPGGVICITKQRYIPPEPSTRAADAGTSETVALTGWYTYPKDKITAIVKHEVAHCIGMVPDGTGVLPDKPSKMDVSSYGHKGPHCGYSDSSADGMTPVGGAGSCVMFGAINDTNHSFCVECGMSLRKLDLSQEVQ